MTATTSAPPDAGARLRRGLLQGLPLGPAVVLLAVFLAGPILYCLYSAFTDMALTGAAGAHFVGLDNFRQAFSSHAFRQSLVYTLVFTLLSAVIGQNVLGMVLALLMRSGSAWIRAGVSAIVVGAWVMPEVVAGYLWSAFLGNSGSLNKILGAL